MSLLGWFGKKPEEEKSPPPSVNVPVPVPVPGRQPAPPPTPADEPKRRGIFGLLKAGLAKTREGLKGLFAFRGKLDEETIQQIEAQLYSADFGPEMVTGLLEGPDGIRSAWKSRAIEDASQVIPHLKERLRAILARRPVALRRAEAGPTVYLIAGVNGSGKTTSIAKLSRRLRDGGAKVILAAGDTFRAAAVEQLRIWSERLGVEIVTGKPGADPASVVFQAADRALAGGFDYLVVDTAGRLHTQVNLMRELKKIRDVLARKIPGAPHEALLVLDATTGQNALNQALAFQKEIALTGIILTKLDGTAKGGIVVTINNRLEIPVKLVGIGEQIEDLEEFSPDGFVEALFSQ